MKSALICLLLIAVPQSEALAWPSLFKLFHNYTIDPERRFVRICDVELMEPTLPPCTPDEVLWGDIDACSTASVMHAGIIRLSGWAFKYCPEKTQKISFWDAMCVLEGRGLHEYVVWPREGFYQCEVAP